MVWVSLLYILSYSIKKYIILKVRVFDFLGMVWIFLDHGIGLTKLKKSYQLNQVEEKMKGKMNGLSSK